MAQKYDPKDAVQCLPEGEYDAELVSTEDTKSKKGSPMEKWTWKVFPNEEAAKTVWDYVVIPNAVWKIEQLSQALGKHREFEAGAFAAENYIGETVRVLLNVQKSDEFGDKNGIAKYLPLKRAESSKSAKPVSRAASGSPVSEEKQFAGEEIPFD